MLILSVHFKDGVVQTFHLTLEKSFPTMNWMKSDIVWRGDTAPGGGGRGTGYYRVFKYRPGESIDLFRTFRMEFIGFLGHI